nr:hypothetical protein [Bradyrhizobium sp. Tv2a-2]
MSLSVTASTDTTRATRGLVPLCVGAGAYLLVLVTGDNLLQDSDSFWQIGIGQWIIDHAAMPYADFYSFTHAGQPWLSTAWLSQVLYAIAYAHHGWAGVVVLAALAIAAGLAILVHLLEPYFEPAHRILLAMLALALSWHHLLARPHVLALPVMVAWSGGLIMSVDRRASPPWLLLPLIALWANLHGGFVLGLALIAPVALEAVWTSDADRRIAVATRWAMFGIAALAASCCTPYGWHTLAAAGSILDLGGVLSVLSEWQPADFSSFGLFEATLLGLIGLALYRGIIVSPPRIALLLLLTQMALAHVRSIDAFAFLTPLALAKPFADHWLPQRAAAVARDAAPVSAMALLAMLAVATGTVASTAAYTGHHDFVFVKTQTPAAAVDALTQQGAKRIFNAYEFGGYLIGRGIPTFIDGRAELYGERYVLDYFDAVAARDIDRLTALLDDGRIDATLLPPHTPAAQLLDRMSGWRRLYADDIAIVHVRARTGRPGITGGLK